MSMPPRPQREDLQGAIIADRLQDHIAALCNVNQLLNKGGPVGDAEIAPAMDLLNDVREILLAVYELNQDGRRNDRSRRMNQSFYVAQICNEIAAYQRLVALEAAHLAGSDIEAAEAQVAPLPPEVPREELPSIRQVPQMQAGPEGVESPRAHFQNRQERRAAERRTGMPVPPMPRPPLSGPPAV